MKNNIKLLDCTLRDGGYYTNWDFDDTLVEFYAEAMESLPIDFVEVGYRSIPLEGYLGKYFYCPEYVLKKLKFLMPSKELTVILNEKDIRVSHIEEGLLDSCIPYISMVRIAIDPKNMQRAGELAKSLKARGFKVAFNVMYMSNWKANASFLDHLEGLDDVINYFYMVDSYGGVMPEDVKETVALVRSKTNVPLGFHGHDNLEMALINTITALDAGCDIVDATITGMGRGAGNLKTELLLTYLENAKEIPVAFRELSKVVSEFEELRKQYQWGTSLPYMFSGAKSLPQKQVMEWVGMNRYPLGCIINALNNQKQDVKDNFKLPVLEKSNKHKTAVVLGAGKTSKVHKIAIKRFIEKTNLETCLVHAGARNIVEYLDVSCDQYYSLVGFESDKLLIEIRDLSNITQVCIYPPFPRLMGTTIPAKIKSISKELEAITFTNVTSDSPLALAIQTAIDLGARKLYLVGFDGYDVNINQNQFVIAQENQQVIDDAISIDGVSIKTFTPTKYKNLEIVSLYSLL
ncbi:aldolase catalytic domain-containing protein [Yeosuana marina]|uniref:aldolase catalytic domain-containing protein n=1 Tax=Yeosuana marina TaxID=1565536 RepID=UPI0030C8B6A9